MGMNREQASSHDWLFRRGVELLEQGDRLRALNMFEKAYEIRQSTQCRSYLGMLAATERGLIKKGIELCRSSIEAEPSNPQHYLNLGTLLYRVERKAEAVDVVMEAHGIADDRKVEDWLDTVGVRRRPVFPFLTRRHPLNKYTGLMLSRLGLR